MLERIRSNFVIKNIFKNIEQSLYLNLIKYNKRLQNRFGLSLQDYKIFNEIEIDIIPIQTTNKNYKAVFINLNGKEQICKIYFDGEKVNRNYITFNDKISKIKVIINPKNKSLKGLFDLKDVILLI